MFVLFPPVDSMMLDTTTGYSVKQVWNLQRENRKVPAIICLKRVPELHKDKDKKHV